MNSVSWLIYLADALGSLKVTASIFMGFGIFAAIICTLCGVFVRATYGGDDQKAWYEERRKQFVGIAKHLWRLVFVCALLSILSPSGNTMYAIAASEIGERVVNSEQVKGLASDATKALQQWIKTQIEPPKPGGK